MGFLSNKGVRTGLFFGATSGVITVLSYFIARVQEASPIAIIVEHLSIAILVVVLSHFIGVWVGKAFG